MCCFSRPAEAYGTKIFVRPKPDGRQVIVYSMTVEAAEDLAMILPLPVPEGSPEDAVSFVNLEEYPDFFEEMDWGFPRPRGVAAGRGDRDSGFEAPTLAVVEVGGFVASFVPSLPDFSRLDERFRLPDGTWDKLPGYATYGFAVFQLREGARTIHPMAFEFPRADSNRLFFPTVHIHDGQVHEEAAFDHLLYAQGASGMKDWRTSSSPAEQFMPGLPKAGSLVEGRARVSKLEIVGRCANRDLWLDSAAA